MSADKVPTTLAPNLPLQALAVLCLSVTVASFLFAALADGFQWDKNNSLGTLFKLRGPIEVPAEIVMVRLDNVSSDRLGQPRNPALWDRKLHADLVDRLSAAGASVIVFDLWFREAGNEFDDNAFAASIQRADNALLFAYLDRERLAGGAVLETLHPPFQPLHQLSRGAAPFMLPRQPVQLNDFWTFRPSTGDVASMPVQALALHLNRQHPAFSHWLTEQYPQLAHSEPAITRSPAHQIEVLRRIAQQHPDALTRTLQAIAQQNWPASIQQLASAYLDLFLRPETRMINFYGPPLSIQNIPYAELMLSEPEQWPDLRNKIIYIGQAEDKQLRQIDNFYSVFTRADGLDLSGVEIAATITGNLLHNSLINPVPAWLIYLSLILVPALLVSLASSLNNPMMVSTGIALATIIITASYLLFAAWQLWMPFMIATLIQIPLVLLGLALLKHKVSRDQSERVQNAFAHYVPGQLVQNYARGETEFDHTRENTWGICMATDAIGFTEFAEKLSAPAVRDYLNDYYEILFEIISRHNGVVTDVEGDALMAVWRNPDRQAGIFEQAIETAIQMQQAISKVDLPDGTHLFGTRIGLHAGDMVLGTVGALRHYEYRAVGDTVNTAARIQSLNKQLGTHILLSDAALNHIPRSDSHYLGTFEFKGKQHPVAIHTLHHGEAAQLLQWQQANLPLDIALGHYHSEDYAAAERAFTAMLQYETNSRIARYYLNKIHQRFNQAETALP